MGPSRWEGMFEQDHGRRLEMGESLRIQKRGSQAAGHGQGVGAADLLQTCALIPNLLFPNHSHTQGASEEWSQDNCPGAEVWGQLFPNWTSNIWSHLPLSLSLKIRCSTPTGMSNLDQGPVCDGRVDSERQTPSFSPA